MDRYIPVLRLARAVHARRSATASEQRQESDGSVVEVLRRWPYPSMVTGAV
jgi:hypothetical protein